MRRARYALAALAVLLILMVASAVAVAGHSQGGLIVSANIKPASADGCPPGPWPT
ncbi:MAG TPA: hypothetical protein VD902_16035 [Symbiobacteriaceae bacterium]|nr:hypothetical protein [Symbiobacteriaceae bacterium]